MELTHNMLSKSNAPFEHGSNGSRSNNNDLVSTTKNVITDAPTQIGASATTQDTQRKTDRWSSIKNMMEAKTLQCGPSNVFAEPLGGTATKHSLHGSNSGSNFGSNGQNGGSTAVNAGGIDMESANGIVGGDNGSGSGRGSGSGTDQNQLTQREAALNKFRQKRRERNFGKKVVGVPLHVSFNCYFTDRHCVESLDELWLFYNLLIWKVKKKYFYFQKEKLV